MASTDGFEERRRKHESEMRTLKDQMATMKGRVDALGDIQRRENVIASLYAKIKAAEKDLNALKAQLADEEAELRQVEIERTRSDSATSKNTSNNNVVPSAPSTSRTTTADQTAAPTATKTKDGAITVPQANSKQDSSKATFKRPANTEETLRMLQEKCRCIERLDGFFHELYCNICNANALVDGSDYFAGSYGIIAHVNVNHRSMTPEAPKGRKAIGARRITPEERWQILRGDKIIKMRVASGKDALHDGNLNTCLSESHGARPATTSSHNSQTIELPKRARATAAEDQDDDEIPMPSKKAKAMGS